MAEAMWLAASQFCHHAFYIVMDRFWSKPSLKLYFVGKKKEIANATIPFKT